MELAASGVSCYEAASPRRCDFWQVDAAERAGEQPLVPLRRLRRHATRTTTATTPPRSTAASGSTSDDAGRLELRAHRLRARLRGARLGRERRHLPDLPRPLPQRRQEERPEDGRRPLRRARPRRCRGTRCPRGYCRNYARTRVPWRFDDAARLEPERARAAATTWAATCKGVRQKLDYLQALGRDRDLLQPDLLGEVEPPLRHRRLQADRPDLGDLKEFEQLVKQAERARDPRHPRRRLQPHVLGQPALRPLRATTRQTGACESAAVAVARRGSSFRNANAPCGRPTTRLVRVRLDPGAEEVEPGRAELLPHAPELDREALARARRRRLADGRLRRPVLPGRLLGGVPRRSSRRSSPRRADDLRRRGRRTRRCCARSAATASTRR